MRTFQSVFHEEWQHLQDPHVRALAWVLTSPGLLNKNASLWHEQVADLGFPDKESLRLWLTQLDQHPTELHDALALHSNRRLGLYAENLLGFYLKREGLLYAQGLQVNHDAMHTVGEFDFLLYQPNGLLHWEFATKFYLLDTSGEPQRELSLHDYMGPNLADNFAAKLKKIFRQQLALPYHPAAQKILLQKIIASKAMLKGWLFYRQTATPQPLVYGLAEEHCRGFWWTLAEVAQLSIPYALILERMEWLAPAQTRPDLVMERDMLQEAITRHFQHDQSPVMIAIMRKNGNLMQEFCRGMVVPDDWVERANQVRQQRLISKRKA